MTSRRTQQRGRAIQATTGMPYRTALRQARWMSQARRTAPECVRQLIGDGSPAAIAQFVQTRAILEAESAAKAAVQASVSEREAIVRTLEAMDRTAGKERAFAVANSRFHEAIAAAAGPVLYVLTVRTMAAAELLGPLLARPRDRRVRAMPEHRAIADAILLEDVDLARQAMLDHLETIARHAAAVPA